VWTVATVVVCLAAGLLMGTARSLSHGRDIRDRSVDLAGLIHDAEGRVATAESRAAGLQDQIDAAAARDVSPQVAKARARADGLQAAAGLTAVRGPGVAVSLTDAPRDSDGNYPAGVDPDDLVVHQQDVQSVVNALWAGGAEAMMIMDQRVVTTSAVRCIGNTLLLQGRTYSPPFVVSAIGDADRMEAALAQAPGVQLYLRYVEKYGLGFTTTTSGDLTLPGYDGVVRMDAARQEPR
jgi:uncharacterized protein YlxW (UPF0749 family)